MKIGITGWNGFIGSHLCKTLLKQSDKSLVLFDKSKHNFLSPISLKSFVKDTDVIVHLAGAFRIQNYDLYRINVLGTLGLLDAMKKYAPKSKIIFASSIQVYDTNSFYGYSKKKGEELIQYYIDEYNLHGVILRFSNVYGPLCKPYATSVIATFLRQYQEHKPLYIHGNGKQKRDYIYISDVIGALNKAIQNAPNRNKQIFDVNSGKMTSLNDVVSIIQKYCREKVIVEYSSDRMRSLKMPRKNFKQYWLPNWYPTTSLLTGIKKTLRMEYGSS